MTVEAAPAPTTLAAPPAVQTTSGAPTSAEIAERLKAERSTKASQIAQEALKAERLKLDQERAQHKKLLDATGKKDLAEIMRASGFSEDEIAKHAAEKGLPDPALEALRRELAETKALASGVKTESDQRLAKDAKTKQEAERQAYTREFVAGVEGQKEKYPHIAAYQGGASVLAEIQQYHAKTGQLLSEDAAAQIVEERISKQLPARLGTILDYPKVFEGFQKALEAKGYVVTKRDAIPEKKPLVPAAGVKVLAEAAPAEPAKVAPTKPERKKSPDQIWRELQEKRKLAKT